MRKTSPVAKVAMKLFETGVAGVVIPSACAGITVDWLPATSAPFKRPLNEVVLEPLEGINARRCTESDKNRIEDK